MQLQDVAGPSANPAGSSRSARAEDGYIKRAPRSLRGPPRHEMPPPEDAPPHDAYPLLHPLHQDRAEDLN
jgi:hypothetical protein